MNDKLYLKNETPTFGNQLLANRLCFRAYVESQKYMAIQGTPDLETLQSFMFHYGNEKFIMQYAGLDDTNGNKIFEGDVVKFTRSYGNWQIPSTRGHMTDVCLIVFDFECSRFALHYKSNIQKLRKHWGYNYEVIGNVFENPDLLQGVL